MSATVLPFRPSARVVAAALVVLTCLGGLATPAGAHGEEGEMTVVSAEQSAPMTISVEVGLLYTGDEHLAEDARVWVDASTTGTQLEPVPLERSNADSSVYSGSFPVPTAGEWTLAVSSEEPSATATATVTVDDAPATTAAPTTESPTTTAATTSTTATADAETAADADDDEDSDDGLTAVVIALGTVAVLVLASAAVLLWRRRNTEGVDPS